MADPDRDFVRRAKAGDYEAFERLVATYERRVYTLARRILRHHQDAEDAVQETFAAAIDHIADFREESTFYTWLMKIATNQSLKLLARRKPAAPIEDETDIPHPEFIAPWPVGASARPEVAKLLASALDELDEKYRAVFVLRDVEGLSTAEAARALGITEGNVKVRLLRARLKLRERLTRALGDERRGFVRTHDHEV